MQPFLRKGLRFRQERHNSSERHSADTASQKKLPCPPGAERGTIPVITRTGLSIAPSDVESKQ